MLLGVMSQHEIEKACMSGYERGIGRVTDENTDFNSVY